MKCDELTPIELECNMGKDINGVVHREPWKAYDIDEVDALLAKKDKEIAELKVENERLKKCEIWMKQHFYCEEVIACESAKNRRLRRELWLARAERAKAIKWHEGLERYLQERKKWWPSRFSFMADDEMYHVWYKCWCKVERKCLAKAEEYR